MATREEWKEFFELTEGRKPTIEEFTAAMKAGEIDSASGQEQSRAEQSRAEQSRAEQSRAELSASSLVPKRKPKKWVFALIGIVLVLGIGGGVFGYVNYQNTLINKTNIVNYLNAHGYSQVQPPADSGWLSQTNTFDVVDNFDKYLGISLEIQIKLSSGDVIRLYQFGKEARIPADGSTILKNGNPKIVGSSDDPFIEFPKGSWSFDELNPQGNGGGTFGLFTSLSQIPSAK